MDNKYMIKMAENRGLFGDDSSAGKSRSAAKSSKKKEVKSPEKVKKKHRTIEVSYLLSVKPCLTS